MNDMSGTGTLLICSTNEYNILKMVVGYTRKLLNTRNYDTISSQTLIPPVINDTNMYSNC